MSCGILQDWAVNSGNLRSQVVLLLFRMAQKAHRLPSALRWIGLPYLGVYQFVVYWVLGLELNYKATVGSRLQLHHGYATVLHDDVVIGADCVLRQCTTIGMRKVGEGCPVIGNGVDIGSNAVVLGGIRVGDQARIGAGSVVVRDVAAGDAVAGNPARSTKVSK